ncbi:MAG: hypothetical protein CM15mP78_10310 [Candidatus Poseidoniales archaeon]|nr:MAG: hypothetical protein CM15mP78_10310 [Candidatus Poseidoniales archaeon]
MDLQSKTVAELKEMLKEQGLPVSGKKDELIARLDAGGAVDAVLSLEDDVKDLPGGLDEENVPWWRSTDVLTPQALMAIGVVVLMITAVFVFRPAWLGFAPNYEVRPHRLRAHKPVPLLKTSWRWAIPNGKGA